tara:strand:+ start:650 stop:1105 length:456 start_codon:yes stop_codon:yes gene_type:complete
MVKIDINCKEGYTAKEWSRDDTLAYFIKGPTTVGNDKGDIGRFDVRGKFAGKFKAEYGARKRFGILEGSKASANAVVTLTTPDGNSIHIGDVDSGKMNTQQRITLGMCLNNATNLVASQMDAENAPQNLVSTVFDLADQLYAEYNIRYNEE